VVVPVLHPSTPEVISIFAVWRLAHTPLTKGAAWFL